MRRENVLSGSSIVSCGTLRPEFRVLEAEGFLNAGRILFTAPGLHEWSWELENQLRRQRSKSKETSQKVIVVFSTLTVWRRSAS